MGVVNFTTSITNNVVERNERSVCVCVESLNDQFIIQYVMVCVRVCVCHPIIRACHIVMEGTVPAFSFCMFIIPFQAPFYHAHNHC